MKTCLRAASRDGGGIGELLDISFVADDHEFGLSPDGAEIHIEGRGEYTVTRGKTHQDAPERPPESRSAKPSFTRTGTSPAPSPSAAATRQKQPN